MWAPKVSKPGSGKEKQSWRLSLTSMEKWDIIFTFLKTSAFPIEEQSGQNQTAIQIKWLKFYISPVSPAIWNTEALLLITREICLYSFYKLNLYSV